MSTEQSKAVEQRIIAEMNQGNFAIIDELFAADFVYHGPFGIDTKGLEGFKEAGAGLLSAFPDFHMTVEDMFAEGNKVATRLTLRCTHTGDFAGIHPTGKQLTVAAVLISQFADGKEVEAWDVWDTAGLLQQLGAVPPIGQSGN
jgi:steroid delta-isomerase-like uncharacterized protein